MLAAWNDAPELPRLYVVGDGPLKTGSAKRAAAMDPRIQWLDFSRRQTFRFCCVGLVR